MTHPVDIGRVKPQLARFLRVLHLRSGQGQGVDCALYLHALIKEFNASPAFDFQVQLLVQEVDTLDVSLIGSFWSGLRK